MKKERNLYVVYDIQDDDLRNTIANILMFYGLHRVQYSVFNGIVFLKDKEEMLMELKKLELGEKDKIHVIDLCESCFKNIISIGEKTDSKEHLIL